MSLGSYFYTSCETRELHTDSELRTRYYRNSQKDCIKVIQNLQEVIGYEVKDINEAHGEIYILSNGYDMILTLTKITPIETGIDVKVNYFTYVGLGRPKKRAIELYRELDKALNFKGVALHP